MNLHKEEIKEVIEIALDKYESGEWVWIQNNTAIDVDGIPMSATSHYSMRYKLATGKIEKVLHNWFHIFLCNAL